MPPSGCTTMSLGEFRRLPWNLSAITVTVPFVLIARDAAISVLAGKLAPFEIERIAVAEAGGRAEDRDAAVFFDPAHLAIIGDIAPDQIAAHTVPGHALGPERAGVEALDHGVAHHVAAEAIIERDDVGIGILDQLIARPTARGWNAGDVLLLREGYSTQCGHEKRTAAK